MKRARFSEELIVRILKEHEAGRKVADFYAVAISEQETRSVLMNCI